MEDEHTVIADLRVLNDELQGIASYLRRRPDSPSPESSTPQDTFHGRHISVPIFHTDQPLHTTRRQGRAQEMEQCASGNCSLCMKYLKELFVSPATEEAPAEVYKGEASSGTTRTAGTTGTTGTASATASPAAFPKVSTQGPYAFPFSAVSRVLSPASIAAAAAANGDAPMTSYFAVFDGHCGREAAHLSKLLLPIFLLASKNYWIDLQKALFEVRCLAEVVEGHPYKPFCIVPLPFFCHSRHLQRWMRLFCKHRKTMAGRRGPPRLWQSFAVPKWLWPTRAIQGRVSRVSLYFFYWPQRFNGFV